MGIIGVILAPGIIEPRSSWGQKIFHSAYAFPPTRPAYLRFYQWSLKMFEGGYLPSNTDEYLIGRLPHCEGNPEETAIIDFQIRQGSGRWGRAASRSHETNQGQIISNIMRRLDEMQDQDAVWALVFIESLRREETLGKGGFTGMRNSAGEAGSLNRPALDTAKQSFRTWWGDGSNWPAIRSSNPLSGTELEIHSGP